MPCAALADGVGERRGAIDREGDIFYFDEAVAVTTFETEVEPAVGADFDFATDIVKAAQFFDSAGCDRFRHEFVRVHGVYTDPRVVGPDQFPGIEQLAIQIITA